MFLTNRKLESRIMELKELRYRGKIGLEEFLAQEDEERAVTPVVPTAFENFKILKTGENWSGRDHYLWLHKEITIPEEWKGKKAVGIFDFGNTGAGNNSGFESLLYLNEKPYQGVDVNHKEVFFPEEAYGTAIRATFRLWSGLEGGGVPAPQEHKIRQADLAWLDEKTDDLYYMGAMIIDAIENLSMEDPTRHELQTALDQALLAIDWSRPGSDEFYDSVHEADDILNEKMNAMEKHSLVHVDCVGHTHIDVAWLWRLKHTREKCSRSFSTVLRLMEQFPEYIFLQTQPQLYQYIKEDFPEIYEQIKERVKSGQWEVDGAMWVEADCNLTSGESLTRQILIGSRFIKEEFDKDVEYLWLPDVFGYSWALPQILKKSGIHMFMTTKISWNQYNRMPHDTFWWKGIDGTQVLTHFITTPAPDSQPGSWFYTYNGQLTPKTVKGVWDAYSEKEMNQDLLICYGFGDGGGGVNRDNLEQRRRIDRIPGLPSLKTSNAGDYFNKLKENVKKTDRYVHTWDGELYLEYHRGTYTSQGYNKRMNRKMEFLYREAEWMTVMKGILEKDLSQARQEDLTVGWKKILTNQFHDIIPGSSIHEVYEDTKLIYEEVEAIAREVETDFLSGALEKEENTYTVLNNSNWSRDEAIVLPKLSQGAYVGEKGQRLLIQPSGEEGKVLVMAEAVPAMGSLVIEYQKEAGNNSQEEETLFSVNGKEAETPWYSVAFNDAGQMTRLYDKRFNREVLPEGGRANVLQIFEDKPLGNDAWDIDIFYQQKMREIVELKDFHVVTQGALELKIRMEWTYMNSTIWQDVVFYSKSPRIDFRTKVDYHQQHQLLKAAFPVDIRSTYATYDIQYGNVRRPNHWNTSWDQARFETVAHRFVDLSERNYGVSLLNDCKYGHDVYGNVMRISLLKAATHPDHLQDQGIHEFTYALLPHGGDFIEGNTVQEAFFLNQPLVPVEGRIRLPFESCFAFNQETIELDAVKKAEDGKGIIVRFHEFAGEKKKVTLKAGFDFQSWVETDLRERPVGNASGDREINLPIKPYEIKTIRIEL